MDIYQQALRELAIIESEIAEKIRRRDALRQFISMGQSLFQDSRNNMTVGALAAFSSAQIDQFNAAKRSNTLSHRVSIAVEAILKAHGPTATKDLLPLLEEQGIEIGGDNKASTLSVMLSRNNKFVADRSTGWKLRTRTEEFLIGNQQVTSENPFSDPRAKGMPPPQAKSPENATKNETNANDEL